jgi:hypothetical protein
VLSAFEGELKMKTKEVSKDQWQRFFSSFSQRHEGWLITLEIFGSEIGAQVQGLELPFTGIVDESDEAAGDQIVIMVGGKPDDHITHTISNPMQVSLEQTEGGADVALQIKSADGLTTLLRFHSPLFPELADGLVARSGTHVSERELPALR